ncbi:hypothetical protein ABZX85_36380 [Streptomyces sp. NPDC004539]|uniref:hypothetical protein n=1 Tax=Streptomyces sp. NPDC004539 TaxID=3154280 RepID=UPI0033B5709D
MSHQNPGQISRRTVVAGAATTAAALTIPLAAGAAQAATATNGAGPVVVVSPCGQVRVTLRLDSGTPTYAVAVGGIEPLSSCAVGMKWAGQVG